MDNNLLLEIERSEREYLIPCPFCNSDEWVELRKTPSGVYYVRCICCNAHTGASKIEEEARAKWNKRPREDMLKRGNEVLHKLVNGVLEATKPEETKEKPLPCPFCGEYGTGFSVSLSNMPLIKGVPFYRVTCINCGAEGEDDICEENAVMTWNIRPREEGFQAQIKLFRSLLDEAANVLECYTEPKWHEVNLGENMIAKIRNALNANSAG